MVQVLEDQNYATRSVHRFYEIREGTTVRLLKNENGLDGDSIAEVWSLNSTEAMTSGNFPVTLRKGTRIYNVTAENCVRFHSEAEIADLGLAWDRWVVAQSAAENLIETSRMDRHQFRFRMYRRAIHRWPFDPLPLDRIHEAVILGRVEAVRRSIVASKAVATGGQDR